MVRRAKPNVDLVFIDEAHRQDTSLFAWMASLGIPCIGLSATPWSAGLGLHYDHLVVAATTRELIEAGRLSPYIVFAPSAPDLEAVRITAGDFNEGELSAATNTPKLVGDIVDNWHARARGLPTIVFCVDRNHARHVEQRFREAGVASDYLDGETTRPDRKAIFARFNSGETKVLVNIDILTAGFDSDVRCVVDARPTKSEMRYVQALGRGLRTAPGKERRVILDHAGNPERLGFVDEIHHDKLDDGDPRNSASRKAERKAADVRICPACKAAMPRATLICSACGHEQLAKTAVIEADATLVEFGKGQGNTAPAPIVLEQTEFFAGLKGYAQGRTYAPGWIYYKFKERFGIWPNHPAVRDVAPKSPGLKVLNWIRSRNIAFAKRRQHG